MAKANFLQMLLGQQAASALGGVPSPMDEQENDGLVVKPPYDAEADMPGQEAPPEGYTLDNTTSILMRDEALRRGEEAATHKGMFGVKGTLRDVLGLLGDAFLVQDDKEAVYMPKREQERMSDALAGMTDNERAAIERATGLNPAFGQKMLDEFLLRQQGETENLIRAQTATTQQDKVGFDTLTELRDRAARILAAAGNDPQARSYAIEQIQGLAAQTKRTLSELGINPNMSDTEARVYAGGDMRVNQQENLERKDRSLDQADYRNQTGRISATRPTAPKSTTEATELARIRNKVNRGEKLSPGDAATWEKANRPSGTPSLLEQFAPGATAASGRFRPVKPR